MKLRELKISDANSMLEWMHDENVVKYMGQNFKSKEIDDCISFIRDASKSDVNCHMAIVNDFDEYMGTVSLKNINHDTKNAEFAITLSSKAMGKGFSKFGMFEILKKGLFEFNLDEIYWYVSKENTRAIKFYDKNNCSRRLPKNLSNIDVDNFIWYTVTK